MLWLAVFLVEYAAPGQFLVLGIAEGHLHAAAQVNKHDLFKFDFVVFIVAAVTVMFAGVEIGLAISIGLSVVIALWKSAFPHTAVLGQLPDTTVYRCAVLPNPQPLHQTLTQGCRVSAGSHPHIAVLSLFPGIAVHSAQLMYLRV